MPVLASRPIVELTAVPFFAGLGPEALERVAAGMRTRRFRRGEVIFHSGDPGDALFVIVAGEVKISLPSETGEEAILADPAAPAMSSASSPCSTARHAPRARPP